MLTIKDVKDREVVKSLANLVVACPLGCGELPISREGGSVFLVEHKGLHSQSIKCHWSHRPLHDTQQVSYRAPETEEEHF